MMECEGITGATVNRCAEKCELKIRCRLKTEHLSVNKGLRIEELTVSTNGPRWIQEKLMPRELAEKEFRPHRPEPTEKARQLQRCDSVDAEHVDRRRIVAEHHRAAVAGTPPQALLSKSHLPVVEIQTHVGVKKPELTYRRHGSAWR